MDKEEEVKTWIDALRSNEFKQGLGYLQRNTKFCCLGVLNEVLGLGCEPTSPSILVGKAPSWLSHELQSKCIHMNDREGATFGKIADFLEAEVLARNTLTANDTALIQLRTSKENE